MEGFTPKNRIKTVSKPLDFWLIGLSAERKQTPHIVEKPRNRMEAKDPLEVVHAPPEQKVRGSNPLGRTTYTLSGPETWVTVCT